MTRFSKFSTAILAAAAAMAACGGGSSASTGAVSQESAAGYCRDGCERKAECRPDAEQTVDECTTECVADVAGWLREDALAALVDCLQDSACDQQDEDACLAAVEPLDEHRAYEDECRTALATCLDASEVDQVCAVGDGVVRHIAPAIVVEATACFEQACEPAFGCVTEVFDSYGVDF